MSNRGRIIVAVDPRDSSRGAADLGARLAAGLEVPLELFTPVYNSQLTLARFEDRERLQHARENLVRRHLERLDQTAAALEFAGTIECHAAWDHPMEEALIRRVLDQSADLLIVPFPREDNGQVRPLSSAQWQLVRHCPVPVLLTRGRAWQSTPVIVAAIDPTGRHFRGDDLDIRILRLAEQMASGVGGTMHVFHAWETTLLARIGEREEELAPDLPESLTERRHREAIFAALSAAEVAPARLAVVQGRPEQALPEHCRASAADLVVMGAIARNPFGRIFIGSTVERVLEQLPCDLLVVKPDAFRTPVSRERWPREEGTVPMLGVPGI
jgi:universal stress protein E